jgi:hypothetical protein
LAVASNGAGGSVQTNIVFQRYDNFSTIVFAISFKQLFELIPKYFTVKHTARCCATQ